MPEQIAVVPSLRGRFALDPKAPWSCQIGAPHFGMTAIRGGQSNRVRISLRESLEATLTGFEPGKFTEEKIAFDPEVTKR